MKSENSIWNFYAPVYNLFMRINRPAYREMYAMIRRAIAGKTVLELATGTGLIAKNTADAAEKMIAADFAENMLAQARKGYVPSNLEFQLADAAFLPYDDDSFDAVIISNALHIIPEPEKVLAEIRRVLRPGGRLIAPNFIHADKEGVSGAMSKLLTAAGIAFEAKWDEESYEKFIESNGFNMISHTVLKASIPLMYAECELKEAPLKKTYSLFDRLPDEPDYRNWVPNGMIAGFCAGTCALAVGSAIAGKNRSSFGKAASFILGAGAVGLGAASAWLCYCHERYSYKGERKLSKQVIEGTASLVHIPDGGIGLDVGCGSGALTIACTKKNPGAKMIGIDRWGAEYASFNKELCEYNARVEGVGDSVEFRPGNAVKLDFADETFDAVTSNYVYHNISGADKQELLLETLRVLKKGGTFAIHDIMSPKRYGDMQAFVRKLRDMGYEKAELIDTTNGLFMTRTEAAVMALSGSTILCGVK
ncbi:MAG: class I SAM-dependent methyltransferase [Ruminiclostridium sp.]|nr:class I SAM-dependent methyltransferase [Ruminiclostridium sp.]